MFQILHFYWSFSSDILAVKGLNVNFALSLDRHKKRFICFAVNTTHLSVPSDTPFQWQIDVENKEGRGWQAIMSDQYLEQFGDRSGWTPCERVDCLFSHVPLIKLL